MIIRMANAYSGIAPIPDYCHHLIVSARLRNPKPLGFPSAGEGDDLESFELNLCRLLEAENESLCALVITNDGLRDFIFSTRNPQGVKERLDAGTSTLISHRFEVAIEPARDWEIHRAFSQHLGRAATPAPKN